MVDSPESVAARSTSNDESESVGGFKSFWRKSDTSTTQNVKFIPQDPGNQQKPSRLGKLFRHESSTSIEGEQPEGSKKSGSPSKRRQQVYQAQKRHRNRKAEYVQSLEAEIARLQHLDAIVNSDKNTLAHQNEEIRAVLAAHSIDAQLGVTNLAPSPEGLSMLGDAEIDIRYDPAIGHERIFMDFDDMPDIAWTSSDTSRAGDIPDQPKRPARDTPVQGDSWAALDFILALEWPSREHVAHHAINPNAIVPKACDVGGFHGHALTTTQAVYQSALPPPKTSHEQADLLGSLMPMQNGLRSSTLVHWQLPHSEIDKLVHLSEQLELDDERLTPAMIYSAIRHELPGDEFLRPVLEALKVPLAMMAQCSGFGAYVETHVFYQYLDEALSNLNPSGADMQQHSLS
ncbi:hypothetical protein LTR91_023428 [Friedmanniomyces endolithicus]|uniref:BZIP domain-containing protein n=1 Tax=Friedmanniomyces endolithicus TaxID=329885 RepID=A0AAN6H326_9PEZI|nr:hypothetical protein LTR57_018273 [Friedmanniomyces endolithicus]KAK0954216.1 hypothetical protein LTR91_023428 [Friedmanniomyces endolithicus]KAK0983031.1 hypothetical protein LTS01_011170 [Friedmanniomyces endolithicus]KAK1031022.1 hypothetical protein LTS16_018417 [Friedmanniomyces endolithicus]